MPANCTFLGWDRPALVAAAERLFDDYATADFSRVVLAVPGQRAGRRLLEILVAHAEGEGRALAPPQIVTAGQLPELLYDVPPRPAGPLARELAWVAALQTADPQALRRVLPELPPAGAPARWLAMAEMFGRLHEELAGHLYRFGDVVDEARKIGGPREAERWAVMAEVQAAYVERLAALGLADRQHSRLSALDRRACRTDRDVVLVATADLLPVVRQMLRLVAERVTALVYAPAERAAGFDDLGCLVPSDWREQPIELGAEQIVVVAGPAEQAAAAVRAIAGYRGRYAAEEITLGVPDKEVVPYLEQRCEQFSLPARYADGLPLRQTGPYRLLWSVAEYVEGRRFAELAALVRHPDVESWLASAVPQAGGHWLRRLDEYYSQHLQTRLDGPLPGKPAARRAIESLEQAIGRLVAEFRAARPLAAWAEPIDDLLLQVYGGRELDRNRPADRPTLEACLRIHEVCREALALEAAFRDEWSAADAIRLVLGQVEDEAIAPLPQHAAIEMLGWLELPLDDAPALIVTGFNDGVVPSAVNSDQFLPNALRRELALNDNVRRYARDAYALTVLAATRRELTLIAGRRTAQSDPLVPSRLLFACDGESIARRTLAFFGAPLPPGADMPRGLVHGSSRSRIARPRPTPAAQPKTSMRVTEFRDYLACPYRYYLRHVLRLGALSDEAEELGPEAFGSLAHEVLQRFGADEEARLLADAEKIRRRLDAALDAAVRESCGRVRLPAVDVQVEQLRLRLAAFAAWQADWAAQGWRIRHAEVQLDGEQAVLEVDGQPMFLRARIDRVDLNEHTGTWMIFDYKTSDEAQPPEKTHRKKQQWIDLQLPLYRHLRRAIGIEVVPELGYIVLPKDLESVGYYRAAWSEDELAEAMEEAQRVVRAVRAQEFWPPAETPPFFDDFAVICQDEQFGVFDLAEGSGA